MVGPGGVGKSSFLRGLMNQSLPRDPESTILADTKVVKQQFWAKAGESADSYWAEVTDKDEIQELAGLFQLVPSPAETKLAAVLQRVLTTLNPSIVVNEYVSHIKDNEVRNVLQPVAKHAITYDFLPISRSENPTAPTVRSADACVGLWWPACLFLISSQPFWHPEHCFLLFFDARQNLHEKCKTFLSQRRESIFHIWSEIHDTSAPYSVDGQCSCYVHTKEYNEVY